ncbi:MAG: hypothetical protein LBB94_13015 [Clostridiales bacterium]|jgi:hypothetical protein|nr:hypothetical protein [Clostridiales bacterium]
MLKKRMSFMLTAIMAAGLLQTPVFAATGVDLYQKDFSAQPDPLYRVESGVVNLMEDIVGSIEIASGVKTLIINGNGYSITQAVNGWNSAVWTEDALDDLDLTITDLTVKNCSDIGLYLSRGGSLTVKGDVIIDPSVSDAEAQGIVVNTEKPFEIKGEPGSSLKVKGGTLVDDFEVNGYTAALSVGYYAINSASSKLTIGGELNADLTGGYGADYAGSAIYANGSLTINSGHVVFRGGDSPKSGGLGAVAGIVFINGGTADFISSQGTGGAAVPGITTNGLFLTGPGEINVTGNALDVTTDVLYIEEGARINPEKRVNIEGLDVYPVDVTITPAGLYTITVEDFGGYYGVTDKDGKVQVWLPKGEHKLYVQDPDGQSGEAPITIDKVNEPVTIDFAPTEINPPVDAPVVDNKASARLFDTKPASPPTDEYLSSIQGQEPEPGITLREAASQIASELYKLKLFVGTGNDENGNPKFELDRSLTRLESLALVVRLLGKEAAANAYTGANPFTDVPAWGDRIAAYAYSQGITVGVNNAHTLFDSNKPVTCQEFTAFLLRVLGYQEKTGDFLYARALDKAVEVGLYTTSERQSLNAGQFLRSNAVISMTNALTTKIKGDNTLLIDKLVEDSVVEAKAKDDFQAAVKKIYSSVK